MGYWDIIIPKVLTNYSTNPSFQQGTTDYSTLGTNTIARTSEQTRRGNFALKFTYGNNDSFILWSGTVAAGTYTFSCDLYIPTTYTGTDLKFFINSTTLVDIDMTIRDTWRRPEFSVTSAGTLTIEIIEGGANGSAGETLYTDGWMIVNYDGEVPYFDGNSDGARWIGAAGLSASISDGYEPSVGYYLNLADDLHFRDATRSGAGMPAVNNLSSPLALQPGSLHDDQTIAERTLTLQGTLIGDTVALWHSRRQALIKALNSKTGQINQKSLPRVLRVTSPAVDKHIKVVYDSGLEGGLPEGFTEARIDLNLLADDPLFYATYDSSSILDTHDSATFTGIAARMSGVWSNLGPPHASGTYDTVRDVLIHNGKIYVTGTFSNWNNIANADNIAQYDIATATWSAMGTGLSDLGRVLLADAAGNIYVGGNFVTAGGVTCRGIAVWDGSAWAALGPPSAGSGVWALAIDPTTGYLYVGGSFENWDGEANGDRIIYWNGTDWAVLSTGITTASSTVRSLAFDETGLLYIGGDFEAPEERIMTWDGTDFTLVGGGLGASADSVNALIFHDGLLYAGGDFEGSNGNFIATWNGVVWTGLSQEVNANVVDFAIDEHDDLWAVGSFTLAGSVICEGIAVWNGSSWSRADIDYPASTLPFCIDTSPEAKIITIGTDNASYTAGYAGATTINYAGTFNAYPIFRITRSGGTFADLLSLRNYTTGANIYMVYTLLDGETLTIDFRPGRERVHSTMFGDIPTAILGNSDLGQFFLVPGNESGTRANLITCFVQTTGGDPSLVVASLQWVDAYISED